MKLGRLDMSAPRIELFLGCLAYCGVFNLAYCTYLHSRFGYAGYHLNLPPAALIPLPWLLGAVPALWLPLDTNRPSRIAYYVLYVLVIVPSTIVPIYSLSVGLGRVMALEATLLVGFYLLGWIYRVPLWDLPRPRVSPRTFWIVWGLAFGGLVAYVVSVFGVQFRVLGLLDVYPVRAQYKATLASHGGPIGYAVLWMTQVMSPFLFACALAWPRLGWAKRMLPALVGIAGQWMAYSITGFKTTLFGLGLLAGMAVILRMRRVALLPVLVWGLAGGVAFAAAYGIVNPDNLSSDLIVRRTVANPGLMTGLYFEMFTENPQADLRYSVLRFLGGAPYESSPPRLIGVVYYGHSDSYVSANLCADAYANFGLTGILVAMLGLGAVLWLYDSLAHGRNPLLTTLMMVLPGYVLSESGLLTTLMSHGVLLVLLTAYLLPEDGIVTDGKGARENPS